jgi:hypothetical protein
MVDDEDGLWLVGKIDVVIFSIGFSNYLVCLCEGDCLMAVALFDVVWQVHSSSLSASSLVGVLCASQHLQIYC